MVLWHINDLKVSHVDPKVMDEVHDQVDQEYRMEAPITLTRGKVHENLGMTIVYSKDGKVDYIERCHRNCLRTWTGWHLHQLPTTYFK